MANFAKLSQKGGGRALEGYYTHLPQAVRDAITLVRILGLSHLWEQQMYFQCQTKIGHEDGFDGGSVSSVNPLLSSSLSSPCTTQRNLLETYTLLVKLYSQRHLTYEWDILETFQVFADSISRRWGCPLFASDIPDAILDLALLWRPGGDRPKCRRWGFQVGGRASEHIPRPSWCWGRRCCSPRLVPISNRHLKGIIIHPRHRRLKEVISKPIDPLPIDATGGHPKDSGQLYIHNVAKCNTKRYLFAF
ncbi:hypothetical protein B0H67DRAFT_146665 [Lasiosphaeris hirsuta]|uniref:Uncharacterized protein n=1 Tax=Lasiosphaeris hirsuta TaxID=260670 RepID=A0AA40B1R4_9PEZI|nr:hypothetical protein B0H67DRAFT_146665 [Lasiosphaeris hirsuta]